MVEEAQLKRTEIGLIPEDWEVVNFVDEFNFLSTASYSRAEIGLQGEVGYIHYGDIHTKLHFHLDIKDYVSGYLKPEQVKTYSNIEVGDLIMADASEDYAGVGKAVEVVDKSVTQKVISGLHTFLIRPKKPNRFAIGFKGYFQNNPLIKKQYDALATGLKVFSLSKNSFKNVLIPLPPLPEQEAIAEALSDADAWIESIEQLIAKKRLIKQGAMQELLTPKEGWEVKKLGEVIVDTQLGGNYPNSEEERSYPLIKMGNLHRGKISLKKIDYIKDVTPSKKDKLNFNDLLFNTRNTLDLVGKVAIWRNEITEAYFNSNIMRITFDCKMLCSNVLANALLNTNAFIGKLKDIATGTTSVAAIYTRDLFELDISFPTSLSEQRRIATILSDMDAEMEALEQQLTKARQIKQGMMQELLTGRVRLV